MLCVPTCGLIAGALDRELVGSELPERFEQSERCDSPGVRDHHRLLHQCSEHLDRIGVTCHRGCRREIEPAGEHREPSERRTLFAGQRAPAPLDRRAHGGVPFDPTPTPGGQHVHVILQPIRDLSRLERPDRCRSQLDGERNSVEPSADLTDDALVPDKAGHSRIGAREEELDRLGVDHERRHPDRPLAFDGDRFTARGEDRERLALLQEVGAHLGDRVENVFAVVEHE